MSERTQWVVSRQAKKELEGTSDIRIRSYDRTFAALKMKESLDLGRVGCTLLSLDYLCSFVSWDRYVNICPRALLPA
jgi:hypothetical protein